MDGLVNDDVIEVKTKREKGIVKHMRKVANLNNFIGKLKDMKK